MSGIEIELEQNALRLQGKVTMTIDQDVWLEALRRAQADNPILFSNPHSRKLDMLITVLSYLPAES